MRMAILAFNKGLEKVQKSEILKGILSGNPATK